MAQLRKQFIRGLNSAIGRRGTWLHGVQRQIVEQKLVCNGFKSTTICLPPQQRGPGSRSDAAAMHDVNQTISYESDGELCSSRTDNMKCLVHYDHTILTFPLMQLQLWNRTKFLQVVRWLQVIWNQGIPFRTLTTSTHPLSLSVSNNALICRYAELTWEAHPLSQSRFENYGNYVTSGAPGQAVFIIHALVHPKQQCRVVNPNVDTQDLAAAGLDTAQQQQPVTDT